MIQKHYIYGLVDPRTLCVRYVGKTVDPKGRYAGHLNDDGDTRKAAWVRELRVASCKPTMVILEEVDHLSVYEKEREWVARGIQLGWDLVNTMLIGDDYDEVYRASVQKYAEMQEDKKHLKNAYVDGALSYDPAYLLEKLKNNFYRPIVMCGELVMLCRGKRPGAAAIVSIGEWDGEPVYRNTDHYFSIPFSSLPVHAIANLDMHRSPWGAARWAIGIDTRLALYNKHIDLRRHQEECLTENKSMTGRTFYAAIL